MRVGKRRTPGLALLLARGVLLWVVVPVAVCVWLLLGAFRRRRRVSLGQFLGWVDLNLVAFLERGVLRPLVSTPSNWVRWNRVTQVTHRLRWLDPV